MTKGRSSVCLCTSHIQVVGKQCSRFHSASLAGPPNLPSSHSSTAELGSWFAQDKESMSQSSANDKGSPPPLRRGRRHKKISKKAEDIVKAGEAVPGVSPDLEVRSATPERLLQMNTSRDPLSAIPVVAQQTAAANGINRVADCEIQLTLTALNTENSATLTQVSLLHRLLHSYCSNL